MSINELENRIAKMQEWEALAAEAQAEAEAIRNTIKAEMQERDTEELQAGRFIIRWTSILTSRFDSAAFKKAMPDVYKAFLKQSASRRFTISA